MICLSIVVSPLCLHCLPLYRLLACVRIDNESDNENDNDSICIFVHHPIYNTFTHAALIASSIAIVFYHLRDVCYIGLACVTERISTYWLPGVLQTEVCYTDIENKAWIITYILINRLIIVHPCLNLNDETDVMARMNDIYIPACNSLFMRLSDRYHVTHIRYIISHTISFVKTSRQHAWCNVFVAWIVE